jgi:hypothetical protein
VNGSLVAFFLDDPDTAGAIATTCLGDIEGLGFHQAEATARVMRGWSRACAGDFAGADDAIEGIDLFVSSGARGGIAQCHFIAAEIFARKGDFATAARYVDDAAAWIERTGERAAFQYQVQMYHAEILLNSGSTEIERARELILEAIESQRAYGSPWMELRCAISLGRIGREGIEPESARTLLSQAIAALPECEDEPRLRLAHEVLADLEAA